MGIENKSDIFKYSYETFLINQDPTLTYKLLTQYSTLNTLHVVLFYLQLIHNYHANEDHFFYGIVLFVV